jgi:hypothetical protein
MSERSEFEGFIQINGINQTDKVAVFVSNQYEAIISDARESLGFIKAQLFLHPFHLHMLRNSQSDVMRDGILYSISGTSVGSYLYGPLGHPGDGEYDHRPIKSFDLHSQYTAELLTVRIEGTTEAGASGFSREGSCDPLAPWAFKIQFAIPASFSSEASI